MSDTTRGFDYGTRLWCYSVNSYFTSPLGNRLPPGNYYVGAFIDLDNDNTYTPDRNGDGDFEDGEPAGIYQGVVPILVKGQDAVGVDITAFDTITIHGPIQQVNLASPIVTSPFVITPYPAGEASLLSYPLKAAGDSTGDFTIQYVPLGQTLAVHGEPASGSTLKIGRAHV